MWNLLREELKELTERTHEQLNQERSERRSTDDELKQLANRIDERYHKLAVGSLPIKAHGAWLIGVGLVVSAASVFLPN